MKINYQSDFKLAHSLNCVGKSHVDVPFACEIYVQGKTTKLVASYDGSTYTNCRVENDVIIIPVDQHTVKFGVGELRCTTRYSLTDADFADGIYHAVSDDALGITLHRGESDTFGDMVMISLPAYQKGDKGETGPQGPQGPQGEKGEKGDKGDKGDPLAYDDLTDEQKEALVSGKADKSEVDEIKKKQLQLSVLDNGNIVLSNANGESKEFMPATPSGDPMHYAYIQKGAEYNNTADFIVRDSPWRDYVDDAEYKATWNLDIVDDSLVQSDSIMYNGVSYRYAVDSIKDAVTGATRSRYRVVSRHNNKWVWDDTVILHIPYHWYLNGLGDISNTEIDYIYSNRYIGAIMDKSRSFQASKSRTLLHPYELTYNDGLGSFSNVYGVLTESLAFYSDQYSDVTKEKTIKTNNLIGDCKRLRYIASCGVSIGSGFSAPNLSIIVTYSLTDSIAPKSRLLTKKTVIRMLQKAAPSKAITITLHADAYARLANDTEVIAALDAKNTSLQGTGGSISLVSA